MNDPGFTPNKKFTDMTPDELAKWHADEYFMWTGRTLDETWARVDGDMMMEEPPVDPDDTANIQLLFDDDLDTEE
jgi:hypothetical protein